MARLRGHKRASATQITDALLERFDAKEFETRLIKQLSGGQKRRIDLAAGLIDQPELLVLDEPTTGLDPRSRQVVWATVRELVTEGITLVLTTQYLEEADALADNIVLIDHGRRIAAGTPSQLKSQVGQQRVDVTLPDAASYERMVEELAWQGLELGRMPEQRRISIPAPNELEDLTRVSKAVAASGIEIDELALRRPTLDDAFMALTGHATEDTEEEVAV